jgi:hypothetical protein
MTLNRKKLTLPTIALKKSNKKTNEKGGDYWRRDDD